MKNLLIAVNSDVVAESLRECLDGYYKVICCHTGAEALSCLQDCKPDLLVIDLMLPEIDGITVLRASRAAGIFPQVVALSDYVSTYISYALEELDVCSLFRYGSDMGAVAERLIALSEAEGEYQSVQSNIRSILAILGFNMSASGTYITEIALQQYMTNPNQTLSGRLYPDIAQLCKGTAMQVERAIRRSVESAWENRNESIWRLYFSVDKSGKVKKPTNADFLARVSFCIENTRCAAQQETKHIEKIG